MKAGYAGASPCVCVVELARNIVLENPLSLVAFKVSCFHGVKSTCEYNRLSDFSRGQEALKNWDLSRTPSWEAFTVCLSDMTNADIG